MRSMRFGLPQLTAAVAGVAESLFLQDTTLSVDCPSFLSLALVVWLWESLLNSLSLRVCKIRVSTPDGCFRDLRSLAFQ